jgi:hypothetical protein
MPSVPPINIPAPRPTALSCCDSPSPSSVVSSTGSPPPVAYSAPFYTTPLTPSAPEIKSEDVRYGYSFDQSYNNGWQYNEYGLVTNPTGYYNTTSVDAANIIKTMRSDVEPHMEASLGGRVTNQHCYMDNNMVYNMMGKYPSHHSMV